MLSGGRPGNILRADEGSVSVNADFVGQLSGLQPKSPGFRLQKHDSVARDRGVEPLFVFVIDLVGVLVKRRPLIAQMNRRQVTSQLATIFGRNITVQQVVLGPEDLAAARPLFGSLDKIY